MKSPQTPKHVLPAERVFVPSDFGRVIQHVPEDCPLVGGQAVAWWHQRYCPGENPITSCDIDFWGYREDLDTLAKALGQRPIYPHKYEMTIWVGAIPLDMEGRKTLVEFIHSVPGMDVVSAEKASVLQTFASDAAHKKMLVLSPVSLVLAKLHAVRAFDQEGRQDEFHLKTSLATASHFITELLREAKIKQVLWNVERLILASQTKPYRRLEEQLGFELLSAIPKQQIFEAAGTAGLPEDDRKRLQNFEVARWPQVQKRASSV